LCVARSSPHEAVPCSATIDSNFELRHLYAEKATKNYRLQIGSIRPVKNIPSNSGLHELGWLDGVRGEYYIKGVIVEGVAAYINLANPDILGRSKQYLQDPQKLNYYELEISAPIFSWGGVEGSVEQIFDDIYFRGEVQITPFKRNKRSQILFEIISGTELSQTGFFAEVIVDPLYDFHVIDTKGMLQTTVFYAFFSDDLGSRAELSREFYVYGHSLTMQLDGKFHPNSNWQWRIRSIIAEQNRVQVGVRWDF